MIQPTLTKVGEVRPSGLLLNLAAIPLTVLCIAGMLLLAKALPGYHAQGAGDPWYILTGFAVLLVLHELIHAVAWQRRARRPWSDFKFGFNPKVLMFYCHCRAPMTVAAYRWGALAPLVVLGSLTVLALVVYPAGWLAITAGFHLAACIGDVWIVAGLRKFAPDLLVRDHPTDPGCEIFAPVATE